MSITVGCSHRQQRRQRFRKENYVLLRTVETGEEKTEHKQE